MEIDARLTPQELADMIGTSRETLATTVCRRAAGTRYLADIGIPPGVLPSAGHGLSGLFAPGSLLRLD